MQLYNKCFAKAVAQAQYACMHMAHMSYEAVRLDEHTDLLWNDNGSSLHGAQTEVLGTEQIITDKDSR